MAIANSKAILSDGLPEKLLTLMYYTVWQFAFCQGPWYFQAGFIIFSAPEYNVLLRQMKPLDLITLGQP